MRKKQCPRNLNIFCPSFFGKPDLGLRLLKITFLKVARHLSKKSCGWYWLINSLSCLRSLHFGWFICYTLTPRQFHSFRLRKSNPSWVLIPHFLLIDPTFAAWDVGDVFSRGLPVLETNFWMTRLIAGYKHSHLFLQGISVYFSFDVPKPTNPAEPLTPANWGYWETTNSTFPRHPLIFHRWNPQFGWSNQIFIVKITLAQFSDKKKISFRLGFLTVSTILQHFLLVCTRWWLVYDGYGFSQMIILYVPSHQIIRFIHSLKSFRSTYF